MQPHSQAGRQDTLSTCVYFQLMRLDRPHAPTAAVRACAHG